MNYLLLMYHPQSYWDDHTEERDAQEEEAFAEFCGWMRDQGITWISNALNPPAPKLIRKFSVYEVTSRMLPELAEVISGYFELTIPDDALAEEVLDRCPHIEGTRLELRRIAD